jgi:Putative metallopeptidase
MKSFPAIITAFVTAIGTSVVPTVVNLPIANAHSPAQPESPQLKTIIANHISRKVKAPRKPTTSNHPNRIRVIYRESKSEDIITQAFLQAARQEKILEALSEIITVQVRLPRNVTWVMEDCGVANAFYSPTNHSITICNEFTTALGKTFTKTGLPPEEAVVPVIYTVIFTLFHEVGHMLIHELNLPITGREEDVADQFSAHVFLDWFSVDAETTAFGQKVVESASKWFAVNKSDVGDLGTFMDEHSLNEQRFLSLLCMLYIKDPDEYASIVSQIGFTSSRLRTCRSESAQITKSWNTLLAPYGK